MINNLNATYLTHAGAAEEALAKQEGRKVQIVKIIVGTGKLSEHLDPKNQTALITKIAETPAFTHIGKVAGEFISDGDLPIPDVGYHYWEIGTVTDKGVLYTYTRGIGDYVPGKNDQVSKVSRPRLYFKTQNSEVITITEDKTRQYVVVPDFEAHVKEFKAHCTDEDPHTQYANKEAVDKAIAELNHRLLMSEAQSLAIRNNNKLRFVASGIVCPGKHGSDPINQGLYTDLTTPNTLLLGGGERGESETKEAVIHIAGFVIPIVSLNDAGLCKLIFPESSKGDTTYDSATGAVVVHANSTAAFAAETETNKVVINRVDMYGFEFYLEETSDEVFPFLIQNESLTFGNTGIPTVLSERPLSYFQSFEGQFTDPSKQNDRFRCVKWSTLSDKDKAKVSAYLGNTLFNNSDDNLVNGRLRYIAFAGAGNGDWLNVNSSSYALSYANSLRVGVQGDSNAPPIWEASGSDNHYYGVEGAGERDQGSFTTYEPNTSPKAYNGECYFLVMGTVSRLNQRTYHPSFNRSGAGKYGVSGKGYSFWHSANVKGLINSTLDCMKPFKDGVGSAGGSIGHEAGSGRDDGRFFDAIYADGLGGVIDMSKPAQNTGTPEYQSWVTERVNNGSYRGLEKLCKSNIDITRVNYSTGYNRTEISMGNLVDRNVSVQLTGTTKIHVYVDGTKYTTYGGSTPWFIYSSVLYITGDVASSISTDSTLFIFLDEGFESEVQSTTPLSREQLLQPVNVSVSGNFTNQVVFAEPAHILACPDLASGWQGIWGGVPNGTAGFLVRKQKGSNRLKALKTVAPFTSWTTEVGCVETSENDTDQALISGGVYLFPMANFAKQTKESTNKPVLNGKVGVGDVFFRNGNYRVDYGNFLQESLIGKVGVSSIDDINYNTLSTDIQLSSNSTILVPSAFNRHNPINASAPDNSSSALKVLDYMFNANGEVNLGFHANELTYDDSSFVPWGDDGTMKITNSGESTFTDLNGHLNKQAVHELSISLGYTFTSSKAGVGGATSSVGSYYGALAPLFGMTK